MSFVLKSDDEADDETDVDVFGILMTVPPDDILNFLFNDNSTYKQLVSSSLRCPCFSRRFDNFCFFFFADVLDLCITRSSFSLSLLSIGLISSSTFDSDAVIDAVVVVDVLPVSSLAAFTHCANIGDMLFLLSALLLFDFLFFEVFFFTANNDVDIDLFVLIAVVLHDDNDLVAMDVINPSFIWIFSMHDNDSTAKQNRECECMVNVCLNVLVVGTKAYVHIRLMHVRQHLVPCW